jgi:hypothetical protein
MGGGKLFPTHQQPKAIQRLRRLPNLAKLGQSPTGQRTMPMSGAPLLPANPLLKGMLQYWKTK